MQDYTGCFFTAMILSIIGIVAIIGGAIWLMHFLYSHLNWIS
ncbi:hypothetical protein HWC07_gp067 [Pantoea phage vB_PagM_LIET2]|uniref:Uncharacterized protein n=1 Tax=Pantoea phage vB_PagM_LIET2 TaxID=2508071 RepID=A0A411AW59_9CAUD|nr:hypothetical protein HWC07_gp067 [Pantoea phage vB_PagM_LIET2]QAX92319.1 hypothetical protein LIET2_gp067 [Pantoea phage vB_PagM_LIET2]